MNLNHHYQGQLLKRLPDLKLPYDNIHKKVFSDLYVLIPKGKKHIVWFTYFQDKRVCLFIEVTLGGQKKINEMFIVPQCYEKKLVLGTIFFGTVFNIDKKNYYSIENIHYYKGKNIENNNEKYKLSLIKNILEKELKSCFLTNKGVCMAMPIIESKFDKCIETIKLLPYKIYSIQNRNLHGKNVNYSSTLYKQFDVDIKTKIFMVKAQVKNDVYDLYLMTLCKNFILSPSTYNYWGAYLSGNKNKICLAPPNIKNKSGYYGFSNNKDVRPDWWL